jgi:hypothetical protein
MAEHECKHVGMTLDHWSVVHPVLIHAAVIHPLDPPGP